MRTFTVAVISAGLSQPSSTRLLADQLAESTRADLAREGYAVDVTTIELRDYAHALMDNMLTGFAPSGLRAVIDAVANADALIAVTPIFSASYSGLFKSFFDVLDNQLLTGKPVIIAATGGSARHSLALEHAVRPMFSYLRALVVPTAVYAATADFGADGPGSGLSDRVERAAREDRKSTRSELQSR